MEQQQSQQLADAMRVLSHITSSRGWRDLPEEGRAPLSVLCSHINKTCVQDLSESNKNTWTRLRDEERQRVCLESFIAYSNERNVDAKEFHSTRVEQLRAAGNGVVSIQAAYAIVNLVASLRARCIRESEERNKIAA